MIQFLIIFCLLLSSCSLNQYSWFNKITPPDWLSRAPEVNLLTPTTQQQKLKKIKSAYYLALWEPIDPKIHLEKFDIIFLSYYLFDAKNSKCIISAENGDASSKVMASLKNLKTLNKNLKIYATLGGWEGSRFFSDVAQTSESRNLLAHDCINRLLDLKIDGVLLEWVWPGGGGINGASTSNTDRNNFTELVKEIRHIMDQRKKSDDSDYYFGITLAPTHAEIRYDLEQIEPLIDFAVVSAYDYHGGWDPYKTGYDTPLYFPIENGLEDPLFADFNVEKTISYYLKFISAQKIILGVPLYGYAWKGVLSKASNGAYQKAQGVLFPKDDSYICNRQIMKLIKNNPSLNYQYDYFAHQATLLDYKEHTFISFTDYTSLSYKLKFTEIRNLMGIALNDSSCESADESLGNYLNSLLKR